MLLTQYRAGAGTGLSAQYRNLSTWCAFIAVLMIKSHLGSYDRNRGTSFNFPRTCSKCTSSAYISREEKRLSGVSIAEWLRHRTVDYFVGSVAR